MYKNFFKRLLDILLSVILLVILFPLFIIIGLVIKLSSSGKVIFIHKRYGLNGKIIYLYKFRTMYENAKYLERKFTKEEKMEYKKNFKLIDDFRVIKFGKFLRRHCLDELPQLVNILKGDMSFIGPRPVIYKELLKYKKNKNLFLSIRPGLTGLWQVNKEKIKSYNKRIKTEIYYVKNYNFLLDTKIFFKTFVHVFKGNDY